MTEYLTLGEIADTYSVQLWRIQKLVERGKLPAKARVGRLRVVSRADLPQVEQVLQDAGFLHPVA